MKHARHPVSTKALSCLVAFLFFAGCQKPADRLPPIREIYRQAAKSEIRNPVIVIHGILGARLNQRSTDKIVWGAFTSETTSPQTSDGIRAISLPLEIPASAGYDPADEDIYASGPLTKLDLQLAYPIVSVDIYRNIIKTLGAGGYLDAVGRDPTSPEYAADHYTCFSFFYDWRRDNVSNAILLGRFIQEKRAEIQRTATAKIQRLRETGGEENLHLAQQIGDWLNHGYKFDIVAHSMGGLIARYYLRYGDQDLPADGSVPPLTWAGAKEVDRLIMVATPNFGAMEAFANLIQGQQLAPIVPRYHQALLGTFPSIYQLLPRMRHHGVLDENGKPMSVDLFDAENWKRYGWGLMAPDSDSYLQDILPEVFDPDQRRATAYRYLDWCLRRADQFYRALDAKPSIPVPVALYLFAGDAEPTLSRVTLHQTPTGLVPDFRHGDLWVPGDGTVPRYSALADERFGNVPERGLRSPIPWNSVTFLSDDHLGLTKNPHFFNNVLFILLDHWTLN